MILRLGQPQRNGLDDFDARIYRRGLRSRSVAERTLRGPSVSLDRRKPRVWFSGELRRAMNLYDFSSFLEAEGSAGSPPTCPAPRTVRPVSLRLRNIARSSSGALADGQAQFLARRALVMANGVVLEITDCCKVLIH